MEKMSFDPITAGFDLISNIVGKVADAHAAGDEQKKAELMGELQLSLAQIAVNIEEAKSPRLFVAGWRPYLGWICSTVFLYHFVLFNFLHTFLPSLMQNTAAEIGVVGGVLTILIGGRSWEKVQGVGAK